MNPFYKKLISNLISQWLDNVVCVMNVPETRRILTLYQFYAKSMPYYFMFTFHISFYFLFSVPSFDELMQV